MLSLPPWIFLAIGSIVTIFGAYRIRLAFRSSEDDERAKKRGGLYGMGRRTHFLVGTVYILMGLALVLGAFGVHVLPTGR